MSKQELFDNSISKQNRRDAQNAHTPQEKKKLVEETKQAEYSKRLTREKAALVAKVDDALAKAKGETVSFKTITDETYVTTTDHVPLDSVVTYKQMDELYETNMKFVDADFAGEALDYHGADFSNSVISDTSFHADVSNTASQSQSPQAEAEIKFPLDYGHKYYSDRIEKFNWKIGMDSIGLSKIVWSSAPSYGDGKAKETFSINGLEISKAEFEELKQIIESRISESSVELKPSVASNYLEGLKTTREININTPVDKAK